MKNFAFTSFSHIRHSLRCATFSQEKEFLKLPDKQEFIDTKDVML